MVRELSWVRAGAVAGPHYGHWFKAYSAIEPVPVVGLACKGVRGPDEDTPTLYEVEVSSNGLEPQQRPAMVLAQGQYHSGPGTLGPCTVIYILYITAQGPIFYTIACHTRYSDERVPLSSTKGNTATSARGIVIGAMSVVLCRCSAV